jgi:hypothetical protein
MGWENVEESLVIFEVERCHVRRGKMFRPRHEKN